MQGAYSRITYNERTIVKTITLDESNPPVTLEVSAAREAYLTMLARMGYPNIPTIYSLEGTRITMERIYGQPLIEYIIQQPSREVVELILRIVSDATRRIISVGVYNPDTTPNNIIVDSTGALWMIDFGIARQICDTENKNELYERVVNNFKTIFAEQLVESGLAEIIPATW